MCLPPSPTRNLRSVHYQGPSERMLVLRPHNEASQHTILSASMIVCRRCAIVRTVVSDPSSLRNVAWIIESVLWSVRKRIRVHIRLKKMRGLTNCGCSYRKNIIISCQDKLIDRTAYLHLRSTVCCYEWWLSPEQGFVVDQRTSCFPRPKCHYPVLTWLRHLRSAGRTIQQHAGRRLMLHHHAVRKDPSSA